MTQVITFLDYRPIERYDSLPWTQARIEESDSSILSADTVWTAVETIAISPVDADPSNPAYRNFTTEDASGLVDLWYRIVFIDGTGDESLPTPAIQNLAGSIGVYATVPELARILKIRVPSDEQTNAMERVLLAAAYEINQEIDRSDDAEPLSGGAFALAAQVNLERAAELWKLQEVQFGVILGSEFGSTHIARDTWKKHSITLEKMKDQWPFA